MQINKHILVATVVIVAGGVIKKFATPQANFTPIIIGGFVFMMALSVADLAGGALSQLASGLAMVAMVTAILADFPWDTIFSAAGIQTSSSSSGAKQ